jgi:hypothetical protein
MCSLYDASLIHLSRIRILFNEPFRVYIFFVVYIDAILCVVTHTFVPTQIIFRFPRAATLLLFHQHVNELLCLSCSSERWLKVAYLTARLLGRTMW